MPRVVFVKFLQKGSEFGVLTSRSGPCHNWEGVFGGRLLAVLEFASGRVDMRVKMTH